MPAKALFSKLRKRRIIETLAAFVGGGWLLVEVVERLLVSHYRLPEELIDLTVVSVAGARQEGIRNGTPIARGRGPCHPRRRPLP